LKPPFFSHYERCMLYTVVDKVVIQLDVAQIADVRCAKDNYSTVQ
jgi:hypothetical protein